MREVIDRATGEILLVVDAKRKTYPREGWMIAFQQGLEELARAPLTRREYQVLLYLMSKADWDNEVHIRQITVARALGMQRADVSRAFRRLRELGILSISPADGTLRINPSLGYKGRACNWTRAVRDALNNGMGDGDWER